jgi:hypothetical protein
MSIFSKTRSNSKRIGREHPIGDRFIMKTQEQHESLVDLNTVESVLSCLRRFGSAPGFVPCHGFGCCAQFGGCCSEESETAEEE